MTIEKLKEERELLRERIYDALQQFLDNTRSVGVNVSGSFETATEAVCDMDDPIPILRTKRVPKITINAIKLL